MASSMISAAVVASISHATPAQATMVAPVTGLKSSSAFPVTRQVNNDITSISSNGGRVQCMQVWPTTGLKKFETLSYLSPLSHESLAKEVDYLLRKGWIPCLEFELEKGFIYRENHRCPGYYDGRYWTMWKLPMFGCTDATQVLRELEEAKKVYPNSFIRIIVFDNKRQVQHQFHCLQAPWLLNLAQWLWLCLFISILSSASVSELQFFPLIFPCFSSLRELRAECWNQNFTLLLSTDLASSDSYMQVVMSIDSEIPEALILMNIQARFSNEKKKKKADR